MQQLPWKQAFAEYKNGKRDSRSMNKTIIVLPEEEVDQLLKFLCPSAVIKHYY